MEYHFENIDKFTTDTNLKILHTMTFHSKRQNKISLIEFYLPYLKEINKSDMSHFERILMISIIRKGKIFTADTLELVDVSLSAVSDNLSVGK